MGYRFLWVLALWTLPAAAAERVFDFSNVPGDHVPPGFRSTVSGAGRPGEWKVLFDAVPPLLAPLTPNAPTVASRAVLAQVAQDPTDEHFPMLLFEGDTFDDFTLTTRFKTVRGAVEQMAGIAFRVQDETNYYVARASSLGNNFRFYKVVNGQRGDIIGPKVDVPSGVWHDLAIDCKGNKIHLLLTDDTFARGKIAFWTKSDSVSYFADTKIVYTPRDPPALTLVRAQLKSMPRLIGLRVYVAGKEPDTTRLVASKDETEVGQAGGAAELEVLRQGVFYYGKEKESVSVTMPLRDRNGDIIAAVRVTMKRFPGETEKTAVERAGIIVRELQGKVSSIGDLVE
jgi:hypothetical protein